MGRLFCPGCALGSRDRPGGQGSPLVQCKASSYPNSDDPPDSPRSWPFTLSADNRLLAFEVCNNQIGLVDTAAWRTSADSESISGKKLSPSLDEQPTELAFAPGGKVLMAATQSGLIYFLDAQSMSLLATMIVTPDIDQWLIFTPAGLYDGSDQLADRMLAWRQGSTMLAFAPLRTKLRRRGLLRVILAHEE